MAIYRISISLFFIQADLDLDFILLEAGIVLVRSYGWATVSLLTLAIVRAVPLHRSPSARTWSIHLLAGLPVTALGILLLAAVQPLFYPCSGQQLMTRARDLAGREFHFGYLLYYWGVVGIHEGLMLFRNYKERQRTSYQVQAKLIQAQTQTLKMQLSPHFIFNAMNVVAALIRRDPEEANLMLSKISDLLQRSLKNANDQESTLNQEIGSIENYLEIERYRFGDRLRVEIQIPPELRGALVPTFLLQPLLENAIKFGVAPRTTGGRIVIRARQEDSRLVLEVEDDAPGSRPMDPESQTGFEIAKSRLEHLFGKEQSLELQVLPEGGTLARCSLPYDHIENPRILSGGMS
ncbi:MAG: histidine kinase [Acidobacteria bacterium]|nr:histidine kinase [Acidobacteriota bacterium]